MLHRFVVGGRAVFPPLSVQQRLNAMLREYDHVTGFLLRLCKATRILVSAFPNKMALFATAIPVDCEFHGGEPGVSFEDDATYRALEPYLNDAEIQVDPYDGAEYVGKSIHILISRLESALQDMQKQPDEWVVRTEEWEQGGKFYSEEYRASRARVCSVAAKLKQLAKTAAAANEKLVFIGD